MGRSGAEIAIYSLNMRSVGRSTHAERTAGAHVRYITRQSAQPVVMAAHMPAERNAARAWLDGQEKADRKNARVIDKITLALPRELDEAQRRQLVRAFANRITRGRAPWFAAIHQAGADAHNPHCHLVIRDRDHESGKRVAKLSDKGACDRLRQEWEAACNAALKAAGRNERIDRRSHAARGLTRAPQAHRGPYRWQKEPLGRFADAARFEVATTVQKPPERPAEALRAVLAPFPPPQPETRPAAPAARPVVPSEAAPVSAPAITPPPPLRDAFRRSAWHAAWWRLLAVLPIWWAAGNGAVERQSGSPVDFAARFVTIMR